MFLYGFREERCQSEGKEGMGAGGGGGSCEGERMGVEVGGGGE